MLVAPAECCECWLPSHWLQRDTTTFSLHWALLWCICLWISILCYHCSSRTKSEKPLWKTHKFGVVLGSDGFRYVGVGGHSWSGEACGFQRAEGELRFPAWWWWLMENPLGRATSLLPAKWLSWILRGFVLISSPSTSLMCWQRRGSFMGPVLGVRAVFICILLKQATSISSSTVKNRAMELEMWDLWGVSYRGTQIPSLVWELIFLGKILRSDGKIGSGNLDIETALCSLPCCRTAHGASSSLWNPKYELSQGPLAKMFVAYCGTSSPILHRKRTQRSCSGHKGEWPRKPHQP